METLVLSQSYQPLDRVSWQRAVTLWALDKVEVVETYQDRPLRSPSFATQMPSVVRYVVAVRERWGTLRFSRENVFRRDKGRCQYCDGRLTRQAATYDHVLPRVLGGRTGWENIVIACLPCNQKKGGRTPQQAGMRLLRAPVRPCALPASLRVVLPSAQAIPATWKQYLFDLEYWHGALEGD